MLKQLLIVVFLADTHGVESDFVRQQASALSTEFNRDIHDGLLEVCLAYFRSLTKCTKQVIAPPSEYYPPDLAFVEPTFDDSPERMYWRTKQNLDYAYLWMYCLNRGAYYVVSSWKGDNLHQRAISYSNLRMTLSRNPRSYNRCTPLSADMHATTGSC